MRLVNQKRKGLTIPPAVPSDSDLIEAFVAASDGLSQTAAAEAAGVGQNTISRWRRGDRGKLQARTRAALVSYLEDDGADANGADTELDDAAERIVLAEDTARFLGGMAPPGEQKEIKVDILELTRRALENMGMAVPEWWYVLRGKVETGEL